MDKNKFTMAKRVAQTRDSNSDGRADMPDPDTDFDVLALTAIKAVTTNGIRGESYAMAGSNTTAPSLGRIASGEVDWDNGGKTFSVVGKHLGGLRCVSALTTPASSASRVSSSREACHPTRTPAGIWHSGFYGVCFGGVGPFEFPGLGEVVLSPAAQAQPGTVGLGRRP